MRAVQVDERDASWEGPSPRFRVYLHGSGETETAGWTDTYDITEADVLQVIDWAQKQAGGELTYAVALVVEDQTQPADEREGRSGCSVWTATTWPQIRRSRTGNGGCCPGAPIP